MQLIYIFNLVSLYDIHKSKLLLLKCDYFKYSINTLLHTDIKLTLSKAGLLCCSS